MIARQPDVNVVRVQEIGLSGIEDDALLEFAAVQQRILLTHDLATITHFAYARVRAGQPMPGVFELKRRAKLGILIDDLVILAECSREDEWEGQVLYLPL